VIELPAPAAWSSPSIRGRPRVANRAIQAATQVTTRLGLKFALLPQFVDDFRQVIGPLLSKFAPRGLPIAGSACGVGEVGRRGALAAAAGAAPDDPRRKRREPATRGVPDVRAPSQLARSCAMRVSLDLLHLNGKDLVRFP
jgi:hypothetical protein